MAVICTPQQIVSHACPFSQPMNFLPTSAQLLVVSSILIILFYLWGALFKDERTKVYAKIELYEVGVSALILILIASVLSVLPSLKLGDFLPPDLVPQSVPTSAVRVDDDTPLFEGAYKYYEVLEEDISSWVGIIYLLIMQTDELGSRTVVSKTGSASYVGKPLAGIAVTAKQLLYNSGIALIFAYFSIAVQKNVFVFGTNLFLNYIIPLGIFLRCFTPTRRIGGSLIGIALTFLIVLPLLNAVFYGMLYNGEGVLFKFKDIGNIIRESSNIKTFTNSLNSASEEFRKSSNIFTGIIRGTVELFKDIIKSVLGFFVEITVGITLPILSMAFITAIVIPLIQLLFFVQAARGLSRTLGEEIDITSITRVI